MIITRSPLRLTFGGGGTDLESYYSHFGAFFISGAINKFVYVSVAEPFKNGIFLKYSDLENASRPEEVRHPLLRAMLQTRFKGVENLELSSFADVPAGTGLGSSGAFSVASLRALSRLVGTPLDAKTCAEYAFHLENRVLGEPSGKQDPYASGLGGLRAFTISRDGVVTSETLRLPDGFEEVLQSHLHLYFTGQTRNSSEVLTSQEIRSKSGDKRVFDNLHYTKELGLRALDALEQGNLMKLAELFNAQWEQKLSRSPESVNQNIVSMRNLGLRLGASGAKLIGAGGGGFLLFIADPSMGFENLMRTAGLRRMNFGFSSFGVEDVV